MPQAGVVMMLVAAAALGPTACGSHDFPSDTLWTSDHFAYHSRASDGRACAGILPLLEGHGAKLHEALGLDWPATQRVDYYLFTDLADLDRNAECGARAGACTSGTSVETPEPFDRHELVHAYLRPVGFPPWLLLEGAAVALSCSFWQYPRPEPSWGPWQGAYSFDRNSDYFYAESGWFVAHLLRRFGPDPFRRLYASVAHEASAADFQAQFETIYPVPLADLWNEMLDLSGPPAFCPWECGQALLPLNGTSVPSPTVCGQSTAQMVIRSPGNGAAIGATGNTSLLALRSCDGLPMPFLWTPYAAPTELNESALLLDAGDYFFDLEQDAGVAARLFPAVPDAACGADVATVPFSASAQHHFTVLSGRPMGVSSARAIRLALPTAETVTVAAFASPPAGARACGSCASDATGCSNVVPGTGAPLGPTTEIILRGDPSLPLAAELVWR